MTTLDEIQQAAEGARWERYRPATSAETTMAMRTVDPYSPMWAFWHYGVAEFPRYEVWRRAELGQVKP